MRLYEPSIRQSPILLNERNRHHVVNVMRCQPEDRCFLFDGMGYEVEAKISYITKKEVALTLLNEVHHPNESSLNIHLYQALCKGEKMDWIIQKSIELGVKNITPIITERCDVKLSSERMEKKIAHWKNVAISATEQSGRSILAELHPPLLFQEAINQKIEGLRLLLSPHTTKKLSDITIQKTLLIFIGPEGGWTTSELNHATHQNVLSLSLGSRILRTETASLAIIAGLNALSGEY